MKNVKIKLAVMGVLGLASTYSQAAFVSLPVVGDPSPYLICSTTGNFGSATSTKPPTDGCVVTGPSSVNAPDSGMGGAGAGHTLYLGSTKTRTIIVNNTYTGGVAKTIGTLNDQVWKDASGTSCIYGTRITMSGAGTADYQPNPATGTQFFEVNDIARGGFSGKTITAAYSYPGAPSEVIFRIGQTYNAVQHRGTGTTADPGYLAEPTNLGAGTGASIIGVDTWPTPVSRPTAAEQSAYWNDNWVDFTSDVNARDDDGSTTAASSWVFVKADSCPAVSGGVPVDTAGAIRLRQTFQEPSTDGMNPAADQRFIEISLPGFAPDSSSATPTHTDPF